MTARRNPLTARQREALLEILPTTPVEEIEQMTKEEASSMIAWNAQHWRSYPATQGQEMVLRGWSMWKDGMSRGQASDLIGEIRRRTDGWTTEELTVARAWVQARDGRGPFPDGGPMPGTAVDQGR